jgi:hypothetical protein
MTEPDFAAFVGAWVRRVCGTSFIPMDRTEMSAFLQTQAKRLAVLLRADPFDPEPGFAIGADLVRADFAAPAALGHTIEIMQGRLLADLGLTGDEMRLRRGRGRT